MQIKFKHIKVISGIFYSVIKKFLSNFVFVYGTLLLNQSLLPDFPIYSEEMFLLLALSAVFFLADKGCR